MLSMCDASMYETHMPETLPLAQPAHRPSLPPCTTAASINPRQLGLLTQVMLRHKGLQWVSSTAYRANVRAVRRQPVSATKTS